MHIETLALHAGRDTDPATGAITPPIHPSTTFERDPDGGFERGFSYIRSGNPNRAALESCVAALEGGAAAFAFASGMAATSAVLQALAPGDHVVFPRDMYFGVKALHAGVFERWGLAASAVDMTDPDAVAGAVRSNTRLVWIETPSNPLVDVVDVAAVAGIAAAAGARACCDNTWATPVLQSPLALGVDLVVHSTTKYLGGHADVMGGVVVTREAGALATALGSIQETMGAVPAPFDCWLALRGIQTLPLRVRAQSATAAALAARLDGHPGVVAVHYPGLASHPRHAVAARQMRGFGAMLSFDVAGGRAEAMAVANRLRLIRRATSLGGTHSLVEHRASIEGPLTQAPENLLRLSVGLEHVEDLWADLEHALGG